MDPSVSRRGTCDRGIWTKPLAFAADAEGYININIKVWGFNGRFAISSPSGHSNCQVLLKREFMHRRILSPAVELLNHPTQTAAPEHAVASAAPAASSKSPLHSKAAPSGGCVLLFLISYFKVTSRASELLRVGANSLRFFAASIIASRLP